MIELKDFMALTGLQIETYFMARVDGPKTFKDILDHNSHSSKAMLLIYFTNRSLEQVHYAFKAQFGKSLDTSKTFPTILNIPVIVWDKNFSALSYVPEIEIYINMNPAVLSIFDMTQKQPTIERLIDRGNWLSICAQTTGGAAGPDKDLQKAIELWEIERNNLKPTETKGK